MTLHNLGESLTLLVKVFLIYNIKLMKSSLSSSQVYFDGLIQYAV